MSFISQVRDVILDAAWSKGSFSIVKSFIRHPIKSFEGTNPKTVVTCAAIGAITSLGLAFISNHLTRKAVIAKLEPEQTEELKIKFRTIKKNLAVVSVLFTVIHAPIFEGTMFHKRLLTLLQTRMSPISALLVSSALFSSIHIQGLFELVSSNARASGNPDDCVLTPTKMARYYTALFFTGLMLGGITLYTGDARYTMVAHSTHNLVAFLLPPSLHPTEMLDLGDRYSTDQTIARDQAMMENVLTSLNRI